MRAVHVLAAAARAGALGTSGARTASRSSTGRAARAIAGVREWPKEAEEGALYRQGRTGGIHALRRGSWSVARRRKARDIWQKRKGKCVVGECKGKVYRARLSE